MISVIGIQINPFMDVHHDSHYDTKCSIHPINVLIDINHFINTLKIMTSVQHRIMCEQQTSTSNKLLVEYDLTSQETQMSIGQMCTLTVHE